MILKFPKLISTGLFEDKLCNQLHELINGKELFLYNTKAGNWKTCREFDNNASRIPVRHVISLSERILPLIKSTKWFFNDLMFASDMAISISNDSLIVQFR